MESNNMNRPHRSNLSRTGSNTSTDMLSSLSSDPMASTSSEMASAIIGSDDEDSDGRNGATSALSYKERRREAHTAAEQKRRDSIKKGYEYLQDLVPTIASDESPSPGGGASAKTSKAVVLQKAIDYIQHVEAAKHRRETDITGLRKELAALQIMRDNYELLVKAHQSSTSTGGEAGEEGAFVPSEVKFRVFQMLMDSLFMSFNEKVGMNNFGELSRCVISWLEEQCTPYAMQDLMLTILDQVKSETNNGLVVAQGSSANSNPNVCHGNDNPNNIRSFQQHHDERS